MSMDLNHDLDEKPQRGVSFRGLPSPTLRKRESEGRQEGHSVMTGAGGPRAPKGGAFL